MFTLIGCRARPLPPELPQATLHDSVQVVGESVEGRPIEAHVLGDGPDVTLIIATIHGNEAAGTPLVHALMEHLRLDPSCLDGRRVVIMPIANPDGYAARRRTNVNDVDLNRNFPAANRQDRSRFGTVLSEPESRAIAGVLYYYRPRRIVSIHQPLNCIDYDGPAEELAAEMARHGDLPVKKLGARPGSLGSHAGVDLGTPIITLELPREADALTRDVLWQRYGAALLAAVRFSPAEPAPPAAPSAPAGPSPAGPPE